MRQKIRIGILGLSGLIWVTSTALLAQESGISVPSGQPVTLYEVIQEEQDEIGLTVRFRFVAPEIARKGGSISFDQAESDMLSLCETFALDWIDKSALQPRQIIVSLSDQPIEFGEPDPDITQFFDAFHRNGHTCEWEGL